MLSEQQAVAALSQKLRPLRAGQEADSESISGWSLSAVVEIVKRLQKEEITKAAERVADQTGRLTWTKIVDIAMICIVHN